MRIGDLTASEATKYLEKRGILHHSDKLIHSYGTCILTMNSSCDTIRSGVEIATIRADVQDKFEGATGGVDRQGGITVADFVPKHGSPQRGDYFAQFKKIFAVDGSRFEDGILEDVIREELVGRSDKNTRMVEWEEGGRSPYWVLALYDTHRWHCYIGVCQRRWEDFHACLWRRATSPPSLAIDRKSAVRNTIADSPRRTALAIYSSAWIVSAYRCAAGIPRRGRPRLD